MNKPGSSFARKKSLQGTTQSSATGTRAFATEIQNFLSSGNQLGLVTDDNGGDQDNAGWYAYSRTDTGRILATGATGKADSREKEGPEGAGYSLVDNPAFDHNALTQHFEAL